MEQLPVKESEQTKPDIHSAKYSPYGREGQLVWKQRSEYTPAIWSQSFYMVQNAGDYPIRHETALLIP